MSGIEVAGLVLGVLPVAIEALKGYLKVLSSVKNAKRDLGALIRDLETEHIMLQNSCEALLVGIVPPSMVDVMVEHPFGPEWKRPEYDSRLRLRLWRAAAKFEETVTEMSKAAEELKRKLGLPPKEQADTQPKDRASILREIQRNTSFSLKRKDYDAILARIRNGNSILQDLAQQNRDLGPDRRLRSQTRVVRLVRRLSQGVFSALQSAMTCQCSQLHDLGLELNTPRDTILVPSDLDDEAAEKFKFHVVLGSAASQPNVAAPPVTMRGGRSTSISSRWDSFLIRLPETAKPAAATCTITTSATAQQKEPRKVKWASTHSLKFKSTDSSSSATQTLVEMSTALPILPKAPPASTPTISNLCQTVLAGKQPQVSNCYGFVVSAESKFGIYRHDDCEQGFSQSFSLRQVLQGMGQGFPPFRHLERLNVALAISASVMHLYDTPWLAKAVTLDDIVFLKEDSPSQQRQPYDPFRPFVTKGPQGIPAAAAHNPSGIRPINLTILSLATILIQVITGEAYKALDVTEGLDMDGVLRKHEAASRLAGRTVAAGGPNYESAVRWCLGSVLGIAGLDDEGFCQEFYGAVVARLEEDVRLVGSKRLL